MRQDWGVLLKKGSDAIVLQLPTACSDRKWFPIFSAARSASAAMVSVGLAVETVGNTLLPKMNKFLWSCERQSLSTTELAASAPMRVVPTMCPEPPNTNGFERSL